MYYDEHGASYENNSWDTSEEYLMQVYNQQTYGIDQYIKQFNSIYSKYPQYVPKQEGTYWCKINGKERKLAWDYVYGWCWDCDEFDYPHFIYDGDLEWTSLDNVDIDDDYDDEE